MNIRFLAAAVLGCALALGAPRAGAQAPSQKPAEPPAPAPSQTAPTEANPFPDDTKSVPVMPTNNAPAVPDAAPADVHAPAADNDPVRSPDQPVEQPASGDDSSSSNFSGMDRVLPPPDTDTRGKHGKQPEPEHQETAQEDENVGGYYLSEHNWRAALSRFESAVVLDPENPDVYWGMAEAQRHLGQFAAAKVNYSKLLEFDPDGKHGKEARKILKDPELANAPSASAKKP